MGTPRVLIVEDEPHIVLSLEILLHRAGYETVSAADGEEAMELIRRTRPDVVLLDIVETVTHILNNMGIDTDVSLIITGDTIEEQLEWLTRSIQRLDQELDNVQAELMLLLADREIQERAALLSATPAQQDTVRREMHERARAYEERADRMDAYLARLFELKDAPADVVGQTVPLMMTGEEPS